MDQNSATPEGFMWPDMPYDMSASIDMYGADMDGDDLLDAILPTQSSFDPSTLFFPALDSVNVPPLQEILAQTASGCFTDIPLIDNTQELEPQTPLGAVLIESFMIPGPWLPVRSPLSTISHTSLATSPLEQISPWTTPGPLQASSPVDPIEGHYMFCPPPDMCLNGPELVPRWPPRQVDEITATSLPLPSSLLSFSPYFDGQDQAWMSLTGTSTALTTFYPPPVSLPAKNTMVGGKQSHQRRTKAGRITK